jgi:FtsP/CotA-like multicopper oxidase with cupredoxin domain
MSGAIIIEGEYDDALDKYYDPIAKVKEWTRTQPLMVVNQIGTSPNMEHPGAGRADKGPNFAVNGRQQPELTMAPGEVQMWRIVNSSPRSGMLLSLPDGFTWRQLAQDGVQFSPGNYEGSQNQSVDIAAGNRADLLVKAPAGASAQPIAVQILPNVARAEIDPLDPTKKPAPVTLLWVNVTGSANDMPLIPKNKIAPLPPFLTDITDQEVAGHTRTVVFASGPPPGPNGPQPQQNTINNMQFSETDHRAWIDIDKVNTAEEWKIVNATASPAIDHPFHIHINPFQVTELFDPNQVITVDGADGKKQRVYLYVFDPDIKLAPGQCYLDPFRPDTWKPCPADPANNAVISADRNFGRVWWDVFPIPAGRNVTRGGRQIMVTGYFKMRSRFVDFPGIWVTHCHILAHEDRGMMTIVAVGVSQQALANVHHH